MNMLFAPKENQDKEEATLHSQVENINDKLAIGNILLYGEYIRGYALGSENPGDFESFLINKNARNTVEQIAFIKSK